MDMGFVSSVKERKNAGAIVVPVWKGEKGPLFACDAAEFEALAQFVFKEGDFCGKEGETLLLYPEGGKEKRVLLVGLGTKKGCLPENVRKAYAFAVKALNAKKISHVNFLLPQIDRVDKELLAKAVFEGVLMANYSFNQFKTASSKDERLSSLEKICFCGLSKTESLLLYKTQKVVESVNFVRDLVNGNADDVTIDALKKLSSDFEKKYAQVKTTILDKGALEKEKMGLILAVGKAATREPALVILEYRGDPKSKEKIAIVGKGITYDTGGLNIKTSGMETMKADMAGAAVALGIIQAAAELKLKVNLVSVLALAENAIGPASYKPGDVYRSYLGKTVEISNTDAEGRLVLADAVAYTEKTYSPTRIIDFATLTGGVIVALGEEATGLFSNQDALATSLEKAAERTDERVWRLPLYPEYKEYLKSSIADIKNSGPRKASSGSGATFIQQFIKEVPWAHLDIAGTAYLSDLKPYHATPATGVGIRLLVDYFEHLK